MPYCTRTAALSLRGIDLREEEAAHIVAEMLLRPTCPVTRIDLRETHICAEAVQRLLASPRLRAIELSELPLLTTDQCRRLQLTCGQLASGPRLIVSRAAAVRRMFDVQVEEAEAERQHRERRAAHRLGWEEVDEPRAAPLSPMPTALAQAQAAIGHMAARATMSAYSSPARGPRPSSPSPSPSPSTSSRLQGRLWRGRAGTSGAASSVQV